MSYVLTEIWRARPAWEALPVAERERYFEEKIGPLLGGLIEQGAEFLGCAVNDDAVDACVRYRYMAMWKLPDAAFAQRLLAAAEDAGFLEYFEQVNFSGALIGPDELNAHMIAK